MAMIEKQTFKNQEVVLDGNTYTACTFDNATLVFQGGDAPSFNKCTFRNIKVQLKGQAAATTGYLGVLYRSGLPDEVEDVLDKIEAGVPLLPDKPDPPPAVNTGSNYARLGLLAVPFIVATVWFLGIWAYGRIIGPLNTLEDGNFLQTEVSFDLIPVLPESLAESYDLISEAQLEQINTFGTSEDGTSTIPVEEAFDRVIAQYGGEASDDADSPDDAEMGSMGSMADDADDAESMADDGDSQDGEPDMDASDAAEGESD